MSLLLGAQLGVSAWQELQGTYDTRMQGRQLARDYTKSLSGVEDQVEALGESKAAELAYSYGTGVRSVEKISKSASEVMGKINENQNKIINKSNFANIETGTDDIDTLRDNYKTQMEDTELKLAESMSDIFSNFEKQKFDLKTQKEQLSKARDMAQKQANSKYFGVFG